MHAALLLLTLLAIGDDEPITMMCVDPEGTYCTEVAGNDPFGKPACSDMRLNDALIEASKTDPSALQILQQRYATMETHRERRRIAGALLRKVPNDTKIWNELAAQAEIAIRFPEIDWKLSPEYLQWATEQGVHPNAYREAAVDAFGVIMEDRRSHSLLVRALDTTDISLLITAVIGLGTQKDSDSLPRIEQAILRLEEEDRAFIAELLMFFDDDRADAIARKFLDEKQMARYADARSEYRINSTTNDEP